MGEGHHALHAQHGVRREVCSVGRHFPLAQGLQQGVRVHQSAPGEVQNPHAVLHLLEGLAVYHALGVLGLGQVQRDVIALLIHLVQRGGEVHRAGQPPGVLHREVGVIAVDLHAQLAGGVGHQNADGAQAHHAQGLALDFRPGELPLALLNELLHLVPLAL